MKKNNLKNLPGRQEKLFKGFVEESDRASVIIGTILIDNVLTKLLKSFFVPCSKRDDPLFEDVSGPLHTFNQKVKITHRLGLISKKLHDDLVNIGKVRNDFAHNIEERDFDNITSKTKSRISEIIASSSELFSAIKETTKKEPKSLKISYLACLSWILSFLESKIDLTDSREEGKDEFAYNKNLALIMKIIQQGKKKKRS